MALCLNQSNVASEAAGDGARRQRLIDEQRIPGTNIFLDRIEIAAGASFELAVAPGDIGWFQMLDGSLDLTLDGSTSRLDGAHVAFLPPDSRSVLRSRDGASLLAASVQQAARFDAGFASNPPAFRTVDWQREPVLDSQHDARKRIYLVTPKLFGTKVLKGEMIIYPAGTKAANHHHEGAEHFMYMLKGRGTAWADEKPFPVRAGDVVYYRDRERHYLKADDDSELVFSEFFVPGEYVTIWGDEGEICTWLPSGRDINGAKPVREIKAHSSADVASPADV